MDDKQAVIDKIHSAFGANDRPPDHLLQGSSEGCEPYEETSAFAGKDWRDLESSFLDGHYCALGFFSEAGFRYFLPAYLIADLRGELLTADPVFHLTHGFYDFNVDYPGKDRVLQITSGKSTFVNPRRYGATTWYDHALFKLSVFAREEAEAIAAYLKYKLEIEELDEGKERIQAGLDLYWLDRARTAPLASDLSDHLKRENEIYQAIREKAGQQGEQPE